MSCEDAPDVAEMLRAHVHGWSVCKGQVPVEMPLGWRIKLDRPGEKNRLVITRGSVEQIQGLLAAAPPLTTVRMPCDPSWWQERLPNGWVIDRESWYFTIPLDHPRPPAREIAVDQRGQLIKARVVNGGETIASGRAAWWANWLTLDGIEVAPDHRREGLGSAVVSALCEAGRQQGCTAGVLNATPMGRDLYSAMGWTEVSAQLCATRV